MTSSYRIASSGISRGQAPFEFVYEKSESLSDALWQSRLTIRDKQLGIFRELSEETVRVLSAFTPVATGELSKSTRYNITHEMTDVPELVSTITQDAENPRWGIPYRNFVGQGTRPHRPPVQPLEHWVSAKFGIIGPQARSMSYAIAYTIGQFGTPLNPYVYFAVTELGSTIDRAAEAMGTSIVADFYDAFDTGIG
jgi:hypothetical protein